jgi:2-hydroxychromene-2-carboxylate isomerase
MPAEIDFWFEFASSYSYPAAMRIEAEARARDVRVNWRPFLLGPIFRTQGMQTSPFNIFPARGRYMVRDLARVCHELGLPFRMPTPFPQNGLLAARCATALADEERPDFVRAIYAVEFGEGGAISDREVVAKVLAACGHNAEAVLEQAGTDAVKDALRAATEEAAETDVFGAPTFVCSDGELFWGNDRLESALDWAERFARR